MNKEREERMGTWIEREERWKHGYWISKEFIDENMYVDITEKKKLKCTFRGLIASSKFYKK